MSNTETTTTMSTPDPTLETVLTPAVQGAARVKPVATVTTRVIIGGQRYDLIATGDRDNNAVAVFWYWDTHKDPVSTSFEVIGRAHGMNRADLAALVAQAADALPVPPSLAMRHAAAEEALTAAHAACSELEEALNERYEAVAGEGPLLDAAATATHIADTLDGLAATRRKLTLAILAVTV